MSRSKLGVLAGIMDAKAFQKKNPYALDANFSGYAGTLTIYWVVFHLSSFLGTF